MAMTRREAREEVFRIIFQADFHSEEELKEQVDVYFINQDALIKDDDPAGILSDKDLEIRQGIKDKCLDIFSNVEKIDETIDAVAEGWKTSRMAKVDLSLMRLAVYEMHFEKLPKGVAINEAVELAKKYGSDQSAGFVNGVLAKINEA